MNLRRAIVIAVCLLPVAAGPAAAQTAWPAPQQQAPAPWPGQPQAQQPQQKPAPAAWPQPAQQQPQAATAPWPTPQQQQSRPSPWEQPPQQAQQPDPACFKEFVRLREAAQKRANAIQAAGKHKPTAKEACGLFNAFSAAETKMIKFVVANRTECRVPPAIIDGMKKQHAQTAKIRTNVCRAAAAPRGPVPPSLSDALSAPVPDSNNIKTGRGTFDTLSGSPLGR